MPKQDKVSGGFCTPESFLKFGGDFLNKDLKKNNDRSMKRFRALFGCDPIICFILFKMIVENGIAPAGFLAPDLLMGLIVLKIYATEVVNAGMAGVCEDTFRKKSWIAILCISELYFDVVSKLIISNIMIKIKTSNYYFIKD